MMERATIIQHLKDCGEAASLLGNAWVVVRADVVSEAKKHLEDPDRVRVVRCSDCRFWEPPTDIEAYDGSTAGRCRNDYAPCQNQQTDMNWYCADGERGE